MIIEEQRQGWLLRYESTDEQIGLRFLIEGLYERYAKSVNWYPETATNQTQSDPRRADRADSVQANPELLSGHNPETAYKQK